MQKETLVTEEEVKDSIKGYFKLAVETEYLTEPVRRRQVIITGKADEYTDINIRIPDEQSEFGALLTYLSLEYHARYGG